MALSAIFGITNDGLNLAVNLLLLFLIVLWLALIFWTHADAKRRIADPMLVGCATIAAIFPFVGTIVYMVVRPPEYLEDVHERELEIAAAEARLANAHEHACPYCEYPVERSFLRCPSCLRRLKEPCGDLRQAARPALEDLPLLRGRGPGARQAAATPSRQRWRWRPRTPGAQRGRGAFQDPEASGRQGRPAAGDQCRQPQQARRAASRASVRSGRAPDSG